MRPALFLDRDGVIIKDVNYISDPKDVELIDDILPIINFFKKKDYLVIVVTNQSGIGRGIVSQKQYEAVNAKMLDLLKQQGISFDSIYFCPYHPTKGIGEFKVDSSLRKPNAGMIELALKDFSVDISKSLMIGDKDSDRINFPHLSSFIVRGQYKIKNVENLFGSHGELFEKLQEIY